MDFFKIIKAYANIIILSFVVVLVFGAVLLFSSFVSFFFAVFNLVFFVLGATAWGFGAFYSSIFIFLFVHFVFLYREFFGD